jgi:8-oxo-dGTP pyrophosphatase MutT (NUDIX family)
VSAVVVRDGRVLLVRYAYGWRQGMWTLSGGYAHHDETLGCAAVRELQEEAGLAGVAQGEIESLNDGGIERAGETKGLEALGEVRQIAEAHEVFDKLELVAAIRLFDLPIMLR